MAPFCRLPALGTAGSRCWCWQGQRLGQHGCWHSVAAALVLAQCCLLRPPEFCRSEILASSLSNPPSWCKMWKTFFCCCLCLSVQCASPLFQQSFFSFLIFFILPKFLSSFIIHLEEAIHLKSFYYIPIFLDPLIKKISRSSVFSKDNKARLFVEKKR